MDSWHVVTDAQTLKAALDAGVSCIEVQGEITGAPMVTLAPGVKLRGGTLTFGAKGIRLTRDNELNDVTVNVPVDELAILNDTSVTSLGTLRLSNVRTTGQILILAADEVRGGHVHVEGLHVERADVRGRPHRPHGFGCEALQGAFTLWNIQPDATVVITAELFDISAGSPEDPIRGTGVFVGGHHNWDGLADGGRVEVTVLRTGDVHTNGGIPAATPDLISGGVFVISGAHVREVLNTGTVTTGGQNDMVLDNWGFVDSWTALRPITSHGASGIGFVNFGELGRLDVQAPITTYGTGARGFNLYAGSLQRARFASIATHGDGSIGVQISQPLQSLEIAGDLTTTGGEGLSLVKGVQMNLRAVALSVQPGGEVDRIAVGGEIRTSCDSIAAVQIEGEVDTFEVAGGISALGTDSDALHVRGEVDGIDQIALSAPHGNTLVQTS